MNVPGCEGDDRGGFNAGAILTTGIRRCGIVRTALPRISFEWDIVCCAEEGIFVSAGNEVCICIDLSGVSSEALIVPPRRFQFLNAPLEWMALTLCTIMDKMRRDITSNFIMTI
jgi:hypothetical protein